MIVNAKKYLVIQTAFLGDAVLATVLVEEIKKREPGAQIDFLVKRGNERVLESNPRLRSIKLWDKNRNKWGNWLRLLLEIRSEKYDRVLNVHRHLSTGLLAVCSGAAEIIGYNNNPMSCFYTQKIAYRKNEHEIRRVVSLYPEKSGEKPMPKIYPRKEDREEAERIAKGRKYVTLSPTSNWFTKQYPAEKWAELINSLPADIDVLLLGAPENLSFCEEIRNKCSHPSVENRAGKEHLLVSCALMEKAIQNFACDSAPTHIASALDAPIVTIFCSTSPVFGFYPVSKNSHIVESGENLSCRPCGIHGKKKCPKGHFRCAFSIRNEQLASLIPESALYAENRPSPSQ